MRYPDIDTIVINIMFLILVILGIIQLIRMSKKGKLELKTSILITLCVAFLFLGFYSGYSSYPFLKGVNTESLQNKITDCRDQLDKKEIAIRNCENKLKGQIIFGPEWIEYNSVRHLFGGEVRFKVTCEDEFVPGTQSKRNKFYLIEINIPGQKTQPIKTTFQEAFDERKYFIYKSEKYWFDLRDYTHPYEGVCKYEIVIFKKK